MAQNKGASARPTGLGAPEGAEPPSRLVATPAIPSAWPTFNLNREVAVKLTPHGLSILEKRHNELLQIAPSFGAFKPPKTDADGWSKFQLWSLMQEFGAQIAMGLPVPFETTIRLDASAIEARSGETVKLGSTEGESAVGATSAETPTLSSPRRG